MPDPDLLSILKHTRIFADLDDQTLVYLAHVSHIRNVSKGQAIFYQGDPGDGLYVIASGGVKVVLPSAETGDQAILATLGRGDFFGELALLDGGAHSASVITLEPTEALVLACPDFQRLTPMGVFNHSVPSGSPSKA